MNWYSFDSWIVIIGILSAVSCALPGCFLVLRRMSMMGDAISPAVLPGLAIGYLLTGERTSLVMFAGAVTVGALTAFFTQWISQLGKVDRGASMGIVFTSLFALGLVLIVRGADTVDLDPSCVLYGSIELAPLDVGTVLRMGETTLEIPRTAITSGILLLVNLVVILLFFKEWKITSFDPALARTLGISSGTMHYLLMILVAVTTVTVFEAVGSILVIAMLIVPPACAALLADRLGSLLVMSALFAALTAFLGHLMAIGLPPLIGYADTSSTGMMAVAAGLLFALTALLSRVRGGLKPRPAGS
ncbi:MAG TPA: metal ABC transporter permease [Oceanipulchritudo sp.]|nr:metal ABC transporter permease [Oceanipulchritudo sp.]